MSVRRVFGRSLLAGDLSAREIYSAPRNRIAARPAAHYATPQS
jgi:hypothetical protein